MTDASNSVSVCDACRESTSGRCTQHSRIGLAPVPPPTPMTPHVCLICGDARGVAGPATPYCVNHGPAGVLMTPFPLARLKAALR